MDKRQGEDEDSGSTWPRWREWTRPSAELKTVHGRADVGTSPEPNARAQLRVSSMLYRLIALSQQRNFKHRENKTAKIPRMISFSIDISRSGNDDHPSELLSKLLPNRRLIERMIER